MRKILIISDSHASGIRDAISYYFGFKYLKNGTLEKKTIDNYETYLVKYEINDMFIEVFALQGRSSFNFFKYLDLIATTDYSDYEVYAYLGFNDLPEMAKKSTESLTALRYVENLKKIFKGKILIISPLMNVVHVKENPKNKLVYNRFIDYLKQYSKMYKIEYRDIYDFVGKDLQPFNYWDENHLLPYKYFYLVRCIENNVVFSNIWTV